MKLVFSQNWSLTTTTPHPGLATGLSWHSSTFARHSRTKVDGIDSHNLATLSIKGVIHPQTDRMMHVVYLEQTRTIIFQLSAH